MTGMEEIAQDIYPFSAELSHASLHVTSVPNITQAVVVSLVVVL